MQIGIRKYFPPDVTYTKPEGGMFLWVELPRNMSARKLFELAVADKVVFVPGDPFYIGGAERSTLRLNFSCADAGTIDTGMQRLGDAIKQLGKMLAPLHSAGQAG